MIQKGAFRKLHIVVCLGQAKIDDGGELVIHSIPTAICKFIDNIMI